MSRWSTEAWLEDIEPWRVESVHKWIEDESFWAYVDSRPNVWEHPSSWPSMRGDDQCLAAKSDLTRCREGLLDGLPFCAFHFDRVWRAVCAFVANARDVEAVSANQFDYEHAMKDHEMDIAMVRDARRQLLLAAERVYFFIAGDFVKIGRSIDPDKRVKTLGATKAPSGVDVRAGSLLGTIPGGSFVESALHLRFRAHRVVGEWFDLDPIRGDLLRLISENSEDVAA